MTDPDDVSALTALDALWSLQLAAEDQADPQLVWDEWWRRIAVVLALPVAQRAPIEGIVKLVTQDLYREVVALQ